MMTYYASLRDMRAFFLLWPRYFFLAILFEFYESLSHQHLNWRDTHSLMNTTPRKFPLCFYMLRLYRYSAIDASSAGYGLYYSTVYY